jgi:predicted GH43/DUF377 family glycosyl hydrolase
MKEIYSWEKLGKLFDTQTFPDVWWLKEYTQSPSVVVFDTFVRVYFCSRTLPDSTGRYNSYVGYIDLDKNNLFNITGVSKEPLLALGEIGAFDEYGIYPASAIRVGNEIRIYFGGITRCETVPFNAAIGGAISSDGTNFTKMGPGPVVSYTLDEPFVIGSPKIRYFNNTWYLWYAAGCKWNKTEKGTQPVYKIRCAVSQDGINWTKQNVNVLDSVLEEDECQASADVIFRNGKFHMFFSYRYNYGFMEKGRGYRTGYAVSTDLQNWERQDEKAGFFPSAGDGWDSESVSYSHLFELNGEIYSLYQGNYIGKEGIGIAKLAGDL